MQIQKNTQRERRNEERKSIIDRHKIPFIGIDFDFRKCAKPKHELNE